MEKLELLIDTIRRKLRERPLAALKFYEQAIANQTDRGKHLQAVFEAEMRIVRFGREISRSGLEQQAARLFSSPRQSERTLLVSACAAGLIELGVQGAEERLRSIGKTFETLVLDGTQEQRFCGRLAIELASHNEDELAALRTTIAEPLIKALIVVLSVGAAPTRDSAVEGLGALLKFFSNRTATYAEYVQPEPVVDPDEHEENEEDRQQTINQIYFDRLDRRRMMALAVAGDPEMLERFFEQIGEPIEDRLAAIRTEAGDDKTRLEGGLLNLLYTRADLLRTLPGLIRQSPPEDRQSTRHRAIRYLRDAASIKEIVDVDDTVMRAHAHFQESVFRTIDVMVKRSTEDDGTREGFEGVLATALTNTPLTLVGHSSVCNSKVRATFALIQTVARLIRNDLTETPAKTALNQLVETLKKDAPWPNLGIVEGIYYVVPSLAGNRAHEKLVETVLSAMFSRLSGSPPKSDNLSQTHHQLIASACFRRLMLELMQRTDEHSLTDRDSVRIKRDVSRLLRRPTITEVLKAFRVKRTWSDVMKKPVSAQTTGIVIAATDFETNLLNRIALFGNFDERRSVNRLLLTRILAAQLRAASQDWREIERYDLLRQFWVSMPTVFLNEEERNEKVRELMSELPSRAAQAADPDLQDFFEHCSRKLPHGRELASRTELPGHVLAMISEQPSRRIADAIAREIDLSVRYGDRRGNGDLGKVLYQVALRGPSVSIFSRLLPRVEGSHRRVVELFKKHVRRVRGQTMLFPEQMLSHVDEMIAGITEQETSETLQKLKSILQIYRVFFANEPEIWNAFEEGKLVTLLHECDEIMKLTQGAEFDKAPRESLEKAFSTEAEQLRSEIAGYRELPIGDFAARSDALRRARDVAAKLAQAIDRHRGLKPPERVMLLQLMQQIGDFLERTTLWYCKEPRTRKDIRKERRQPAMFYAVFAKPEISLCAIFGAMKSVSREEFKTILDRHPTDSDARRDISVLFGKTGEIQPNVWAAMNRNKKYFVEAALDRCALDAETRGELLEIFNAAREAPPEFSTQRARFEKFFVGWMESELDVEMLKTELSSRWSWLFRTGYHVMTSFFWTSVMILLPCILAIELDLTDRHDIEGIGFLLVGALILTTVLLSLMRWLRALPTRTWTGVRRLAIGVWQKLTRREATINAEKEKPPSYRQAAILPRLARLVAVPMALIVDFEHSYTFPLHSSTWVLLLLMILSFLTTWFFVDREIVVNRSRKTHRTKRRRDEKLDRSKRKELSERGRIMQIVAVALTHSYLVAVLFAIVFGSHADDIKPHFHEQGSRHVTRGVVGAVEAIAKRVDQATAHHKHPLFLGVLPRDVEFDTASFVRRFGRDLPEGLAGHLHFTFYPTIVLMWTALGLFIGMFLEGFVKGETLTGESKSEKQPQLE